MFNGSSNIVIQGGTFIVINGDIYQAAPQSSVGVENHHCHKLDPFFRICRVPDTKPETYPSFGCHSTVSSGASVHAHGQCLERRPCPTQMPTISSEGSFRDDIMSTPTPMSVNASRGKITTNNDSHSSILNARLFLKTTIRHARKIFKFFRA